MAREHRLRGQDPHHVILAKGNARMLPPEVPADLEPAYRAAVLRLMCNDTSAWKKIQQLRAEEARRLRGGR